MNIAVTIPCAGREDLLVACLKSLGSTCADGWSLRRPVESMAPPIWTVVVCDGEYEPPSTVRALVRGPILENGEQKGIAYSWNRGIGACLAAGADAVLVLNDDVELPTGWYRLLADFLERRPDKMIVCCPDRLTVSMWAPWMMPSGSENHLPENLRWGRRSFSAGDYPGGFEAYAARFRDTDAEAALASPEWAACRMNGAAFCVRKETVADIGLFDESFPCTGEDYDYWYRALERYGPERLGAFMRLFVHHLRGQTISSQPRREVEERILLGRALLARKWAGKEALREWFECATTLPLTETLAPVPVPR